MPDASADGAARAFRPLTDDVLATLSNATTFQTFLALSEEARTPEAVAAEVGIGTAEAVEQIVRLVQAGLVDSVASENGGPRHYRVRHPNVVDVEASPGARLVFRLTLVTAAEQVVQRARRALRERHGEANVGVALVTLPDDDAVFREAMIILEDAEQRLKALARRHPSPTEGPRVRVALFAGSQR